MEHNIPNWSVAFSNWTKACTHCRLWTLLNGTQILVWKSKCWNELTNSKNTELRIDLQNQRLSKHFSKPQTFIWKHFNRIVESKIVIFENHQKMRLTKEVGHSWKDLDALSKSLFCPCHSQDWIGLFFSCPLLGFPLPHRLFDLQEHLELSGHNCCRSKRSASSNCRIRFLKPQNQFSMTKAKKHRI